MTENLLPYFIKLPGQISHPIIISAPHVGTEFPPALRERFKRETVRFPEDADWLVHRLYQDIADEFGLPMLWGRYSRYVVDLNRDPAGARLYEDGRNETNVVPLRSFANADLYRQGCEPTPAEISARIVSFHQPYYAQIEALTARLHEDYRHVLFYDAHSIKRHVPSVRPEPFADMILGTNGGTSAATNLIEAAWARLTGSSYDVRRDEVFKGGHLTRHFGQPGLGTHALQLERAWDTYLCEDPRQIDEAKAGRLKTVLREMMADLVAELAIMNNVEKIGQ